MYSNPFASYANPAQLVSPSAPFYGTSYSNHLPQSTQAILPQQQVIQVSGKASVDTIQMAPNSSVLVLDTTAPMVWLCVSDGVGRVTATPYDITLHEDKPEPVDNTAERLTALETALAEMQERINSYEPNADKPKSK